MLKLNTKMPAGVIKPYRTELALPKELSDALLLALGRKTPVATSNPSEVQTAGKCDLQIEGGTLGHIETVTAVVKDSGQPRRRSGLLGR